MEHVLGTRCAPRGPRSRWGRCIRGRLCCATWLAFGYAKRPPRPSLSLVRCPPVPRAARSGGGADLHAFLAFLVHVRGRRLFLVAAEPNLVLDMRTRSVKKCLGSAPYASAWGAASLLPLVRYARILRNPGSLHNLADNRLAGGSDAKRWRLLRIASSVVVGNVCRIIFTTWRIVPRCVRGSGREAGMVGSAQDGMDVALCAR